MKRCFCAILILLLLLPMLIGCGEDADEDLKRQIAEYRENKIEAYEKENERYADDEVEVCVLRLRSALDLAQFNGCPSCHEKGNAVIELPVVQGL